MALVCGQFEDLFLLVGDKTVAYCWRCATIEDVARVGHREMFEATGIGQYPGHHVDNLAAMKVDNAEGGAALDFKGMAVAAGDDVLLCLWAVIGICRGHRYGRRGMRYFCHFGWLDTGSYQKAPTDRCVLKGSP